MQIEQLRLETIQEAAHKADKTASGGWSEAFRTHLFDLAFRAGMEQAAVVCEGVKGTTPKAYADAVRIYANMMDME